MLVYRIGHKKYIGQLQASGIEARWNSAGRKVIYTAESIALALLENLVRRKGAGFNDDFGIAVIHIPDELQVLTLNAHDLDKKWRDFRNYGHCQSKGDQWLDEMRTAALKVPSAVLPEANNYVLNVNHPEFKKVGITGITNLVPDERLEAILKAKK